jgi:biotin carboxylase
MNSSRRTVVLLATTTTYRAEDFLEAARRLDVDVIRGSDRCHRLAEHWPEGAIPLHLDEPDEAARHLVQQIGERPVAAIVGTDERTVLVAAVAARTLGLRHTPVEAALAARDKHRMRERLARKGVPSPGFMLASVDEPPEQVARRAGYPCVVKPLLLSASRGVMRADDETSFARAWLRLRSLLDRPELRRMDDVASRQALIEEYVPGEEVALEGLLCDGELRVLALFDKPDELCGPFFEETLYVTPSRQPPEVQRAVAICAARAARALGLGNGPIHAELRLGPRGPVVIEAAARTIGGLCSRALRFGAGVSLEELVLRHALGLDVASLALRPGASGVMMIPIPRAGVLRRFEGVDLACGTPGIDGVEITARIGQALEPLPEGAAYLGFLFARADTPAQVESALRSAHAHLRFDISREIT